MNERSRAEPGSHGRLEQPLVALALLTLVLTAGGTLLANELHPEFAWFYWLIGTGGPIQPAAAAVGGSLGLRRRASG